MDHIVTSPTSPVPVVVERWLSRSRYLRWIDAGIAWLVLAVLAASVLPRSSAGSVALASAVVLVLATMVPALRIRLRPGDRAWFVRDGRADPVLITACHGLRLSIALPNRGEAETISVRRTRVLLVPF